ncbi:TldD/PmbA family protein [Sphingomonas carotinifaciens]|uniref:PmbA protein n=1 Tax=Sphingomonas carotinifaciens TaxID=1166323 RepID=A0A1G7FYE1_9SPHN|nr:metallopeptidase TldD-related protein [Sphingomonas carotinifaciens]MBB4086294.1 PmbA protein [Sphingomonas carotinifaciens]MWC42615.1 TldD/PmbA family protein [Sphingomonas carotinifaciens]SDE80904.1 PmbA protein [Sphingomonas carotinifaciens]
MLTPDQARDRAHDIVSRARAAGADAADAVFAADAALDVSVRLGKLEDVGRSESEELGLRVFVGRRSASVSTSDLSGDAFDRMVERALAMAREAPEDPWAGLAPQDRLLHGTPPLLDLDDGGEASPESLRDAALAAEDAALAVAGVTNSEGGGASASRSVYALATSHGFAGGYAATGYGVSVAVLAGEGGAMQRDYAHHGARRRRHLDAPDAIGRLAGERAVARVDPGKLASGPMPVVFDRRVGSSLVGHLIGAIAGAAITRRTSFLLDALGTQVLSPGIAILDDPHRPHGLRSRPFDGEGLPVSPTEIVVDGVLQTWLLDSASARQLSLEPTGHAARGVGGAPGVSTSNLYMAAGHVPVETLIADIADGVYVTELIGQGVNGVTGDYSRGAAGFRIVNGGIAGPVAEFTIAGNLKEMFRAMTPANDLEFRHGINVPTLRVDGMTIAGG